jgi:polyhydroxyalkanoate synthase subunit PhaC
MRRDSRLDDMKAGNPEAIAPAGPSGSRKAPTVNPMTALADAGERTAAMARLTGGLSPNALALAYLDWATHLAASPRKQMELCNETMRSASRLGNFASPRASGTERSARDERFPADAWGKWPFGLMAQAFHLQQRWWQTATIGVPGVSAKHEELVAFMTRQFLDAVAPSNFPLTNPEILWRTFQTGGRNLVQGFERLVADAQRAAEGLPPAGTENFIPGQTVALTPGNIVFRNELIELIQYAPAASAVRPEPVLFIPSWLRKYYVADLSPSNSLVRYLIEHGFTVFMVSWKNPQAEDRNLGLEDYRALGVMEALDALSAIAPYQKIHACGHGLGGTLLSIAAAAMERDGDGRLGTLTLLGTQTDFAEAGEQSRFVDESQVAFIEDLMRKPGFLDSRFVAEACDMLHSRDLAASRVIREYFLGGPTPTTDLMAWNADAMRVPFSLHAECLRKLYLNNDLAQGRLSIAGQLVKLCDIRIPVFLVGGARDHAAPWQSAFEIARRVKSQVTCVLTNGGHASAVVPTPGDTDAFRLGPANSTDSNPERFLAEAQQKEGSWWPEWTAWLSGYSGPVNILQAMGAPQSGYPVIDTAPGTYVLQRRDP